MTMVESAETIEIQKLRQELNLLRRQYDKDTTEYKLVAELMVVSEIRYRRLFESAKDGILILDAETGVIMDVNPFMINLLGYSKEEFLKKSIWDIGAFKNIIENHDKFLELQQKEYVRYDDLPIEKRDGKLVNVEFVSNVYREDHQDVIQCNIRDISERKETQKELIKAKEKAEESDRLKSAFLANMSHEIRTPTSGILGFADLLKKPDLSSEKQQEYINMIEQSGARMLNIINDIIDISRIESGLMEVHIKDSNINDQMDYIYTFFKPECDKKGIQFFLKKSFPATEAIIKTDREKLFAIFTNLIKNAIKFSNEGSIVLGYEKKGNTLEFFVKDSGIGIPKDKLEGIFERFVRADIFEKRASQGSGLGLSISKEYIKMLGGKIWVTSEVGKGSTFYFTLPYNAIGPEEITGTKEIGSIADKMDPLKNLKIIIAEDDKISKLILVEFTSQYCKEIIQTGNGIEAIEACHLHPDTDLILMDIQMPEMNGYEATRQIRKFNKGVVIIAQTAYALASDREKAIDAGCDDYITKPFSQKSLLEIMKKHLLNN